MSTIINERYRTDPDADVLQDMRVSDGSLQAKDLFGGLLAAIMTLGPLAATALFAH